MDDDIKKQSDNNNMIYTREGTGILPYRSPRARSNCRSTFRLGDKAKGAVLLC